MSLAEAFATENQDNITVSIPRKNLFTSQALEVIMQQILQGEGL
ncbi:MAG: DUF4365 domain-containing protein [Okeania sp. SIO2F4]|nr:hypothetical protein [Okeania sp. SIO2F4]MDJ0515113.1 hypothetical protein [Trichodesmium sp. MO_231.B1]NES05527.1 DUF4365 domain-containing protein [Okeania sp. SIO2F4]